MNKNALIIFARNPVMGKVKTRLAKSIGEEKALEIYKKLLDRIYRQTKDLNCKKFLFLTDHYDKELFDPGFTQVIQKGADLGEKMFNAIEYVLKGVSEKVILIGTDVPELDSQIIKEGFEKLSSNDIIIGPAKDGGYYLIGMKEPSKYLFENMKWSNENVLKNTIEKISSKSKSYYLLKELSDLDNEEDLERMGSV